MRANEGNGFSIYGKNCSTTCGHVYLPRNGWQYAGALIAHPGDVGERSHKVDEHLAALSVEIHEHSTVEYHDTAVFWRRLDQLSCFFKQVTTDKVRRLSRGYPRGGAQSFPSNLVFGPYKGFQPRQLIGVTNVHRIQVDPGTPFDIRHSRRGAGRIDDARDDYSAWSVGWIHTNNRVTRVVTVAISVGIEAQPSGSTNFNEGERAVKSTENRKQHSTPRCLVSLRGALHHNRHDLRPVRYEPLAKVCVWTNRRPKVASSSEHKVRLFLNPGKLRNEGEHLSVICDRDRPVIVDFRNPASFTLGKASVHLRCVMLHTWTIVEDGGMPELNDDELTRTLTAYENGVAKYVDRTSTRRSTLVDDLLRLVATGSNILELGSGTGRDADALELSGVRVCRTDGAIAFVERLRSAGHSALVLDVRTEDFGGPYDAVFANAVLLHVPRLRLASVLSVARRATRPGGMLVASFKQGAGEGWSYEKLDHPRHFTYWQEDALKSVVTDAGWIPLDIYDSTQKNSVERWINVTAQNALA